ncbi:uncharacterized protein LOC117107807 [Anneissia japonica]|uniref:uncharacterized protein LOC117107807 n=1 Tax=Anneissia japonica TaxID=1529436 RepID=UPI0014258E6C|nr:uncharacterized protein LOC117107807 [Anneissia japonica]
MNEINQQLLSAEADAVKRSTELENTLKQELGIDPIPVKSCTEKAADVDEMKHVSFEPQFQNHLLDTSHLHSSAVNIGQTFGNSNALKVIDSLGHSAAAYQAAKDRLERKYGGHRRKMAIYLEQLEQFRTMRPGNAGDIDKFADLLDVTVINLNESGNEDELRSGSLYNLLQRKMPENMLSRYYRWVYETKVNESVESLRIWINKEAEFQTIAHETITGIMTENKPGNNTSRKQEKTRTMFSNSSSYRVCTLCNANHGIWACDQFKEMNIKQRWDFAKTKNLCYRCLGANHRGRDCTRSRVCGLSGLPVILKNGLKKITVNALLDDGSSQTYINSDIAGELGLQGKFEKIKVNVLNGKIDVFDTMPVCVGLESIDGKVNMKVNALTTDKVTGDMHVTNWNTVKSKWKHLEDIDFPSYRSKQIIDILIGLDLHFSINEVRGGIGEPIARLTPLGWTCIGNPNSQQQTAHAVNFARTYHSCARRGAELDKLDSKLKQFWEIEHYGIKNEVPVFTQDEKLAVNKVEIGIKLVNGRYQVPIPWKAERETLPENYDMAVRRLECAEKRLRNPDIAASYSPTIDQYVQKGYIRKITEHEKQPMGKWYLPHFAIVKPDRSTTKTRIVFDASARKNDVCLQLSCEMYLRIEIDPDDRPYRFLWRELDLTKRPDEYEFNKIVFGVNASPFLAQFVSQIHARKFAAEFPLASETVLKSTYMDDSMDSVKNYVEELELYRQLSGLWSRAGMYARKWLSNSTKVLHSILLKDRSSEIILESNPLPTIKTLGILWVAEEDVFIFRCTPPLADFKMTKRNILSKIATVFDPLGFLSPYIIRAKVLIQEMWAAGIDWDDNLDDNMELRVNRWFEELNHKGTKMSTGIPQ